MSYLIEDSKYLLTNISALYIGGYLKDHDEFKLSILLNGEYNINDNITYIEDEIIDTLPPTWFNRAKIIVNETQKTISSVIVKFK